MAYRLDPLEKFQFVLIGYGGESRDLQVKDRYFASLSTG